MIVLDKVFRQKDSSFLRLLNELRRGIVSKSTNTILNQKVNENNQKLAKINKKKLDRNNHKKDEKDNDNVSSGENDEKESLVQPTKLYATNKDVDSYNLSELNKLSKEKGFVNYLAVDVGIEQYLRQLVAGIKAPALLELRIGAQVKLNGTFLCRVFVVSCRVVLYCVVLCCVVLCCVVLCCGVLCCVVLCCIVLCCVVLCCVVLCCVVLCCVVL